MITELVYKVPLLPVHDVERVGSTFAIVRFLGQLDQLHELVVDDSGEPGVLAGELFQVVAVLGSQLGRDLRVLDLQGLSQATIALNLVALFVAVELVRLLAQVLEVDPAAAPSVDIQVAHVSSQ